MYFAEAVNGKKCVRHWNELLDFQLYYSHLVFCMGAKQGRKCNILNAIQKSAMRTNEPEKEMSNRNVDPREAKSYNQRTIVSIEGD